MPTATFVILAVPTVGMLGLIVHDMTRNHPSRMFPRATDGSSYQAVDIGNVRGLVVVWVTTAW